MTAGRQILIAMVLLMVVAVVPPATGQEAADTLFITKDNEQPSNADIALALSEATPLDDATRVILARDDEFADALASGVLQQDAPLLLTPPAAIPDAVLDRIAAIGPTEVVLLGGQAALPAAIAEQLDDVGYTVNRREGPSRFETATDIADKDAQDATTAILVRAFASPDSTDPTQGFADSLAAGGLAAENGWPVLLTQTEVLTESTEAYIRDSAIEDVLVVGGTAAVSQAVVNRLTDMGRTVQRVAGPSRADTALEIAKIRGADSAADVARVTLVAGEDPDAWAGGFAAAAHSALFDAPIVLGRRNGLPGVTQGFLRGEPTFAGVPVDPEGIRLTCVLRAGICRAARDLLGLAPLDEPLVEGDCPLWAVDPRMSSDGSTVAYVATEGCPAYTGPPDGASLVVVDVATGLRREIPLPDTADQRRVTDLSANGSVATVLTLGEVAEESPSFVIDLADERLYPLPQTARLGDRSDVLALGGSLAVALGDCPTDGSRCPLLYEWQEDTSTSVDTDLCAEIRTAVPDNGQSYCQADPMISNDGAIIIEAGGPLDANGESIGQIGIARHTVADGRTQVFHYTHPAGGRCDVDALDDAGGMVIMQCGDQVLTYTFATRQPTAVAEGDFGALSPDGQFMAISVGSPTTAARVITVDTGEVGLQVTLPSHALGLADDGSSLLFYAPRDGLDILRANP